MSLHGKTVMITGGGVRLGRAMAWSIAHQGGHVLLHYNRSHQPAEELQSEGSWYLIVIIRPVEGLSLCLAQCACVP